MLQFYVNTYNLIPPLGEWGDVGKLPKPYLRKIVESRCTKTNRIVLLQDPSSSQSFLWIPNISEIIGIDHSFVSTQDRIYYGCTSSNFKPVVLCWVMPM